MHKEEFPNQVPESVTPESGYQERVNSFWSCLIENADEPTKKRINLLKEKYQAINYEDALKELGSVPDEQKGREKNDIAILSTDARRIDPQNGVFLKTQKDDGGFVYVILERNYGGVYTVDFIEGSNKTLSGSDFNSTSISNLLARYCGLLK